MRITIVATSARWLAESCIRAGWQPEAIGLFGDWDLQQCCPAKQVSDLDQALAESCGRNGPVLFGAGFEQLAVSRPNAIYPALTLNSPIRSVSLCRNPGFWAGLLRKAGYRVPGLCLDAAEFSVGEKEWLVKPVAGAGGIGISRFDTTSRAQIAPGEFLQQYVPGTPASLVAVADGHSARLPGCFQQIVGEPEFGAASEFGFVGSVGPISFGERVREELKGIVNEIASGCGLRGIFGVDFVINNNRPVVVEINPRPTSSCELLEIASGESLLPLHVQALTNSLPDCIATAAIPGESPVCFGKAYVFWNRPDSAKVAPAFHDWLMRQHSARMAADIPMPHSVIRSKSPIATVLASGPGSAQVLELLRVQATELLERLAACQ